MEFCLIGEKLSHSYSAIIHNSCGLNYTLKSIEKGKLKDFLLKNNFNGFNVTIPYKKDIMPYLDFISNEAREIGAVNTVKMVNGKLYGYNTDIFGIEYLFKKSNINVKNKNVVILGSGGASNCAQYYAKKSGAKSVTVVGRSSQYNYTNVYSLTQTEILVNATPVGMYPNNETSLVNLQKFAKIEGVVDLIYNPLVTDLLYQAKKLSIKYANGIGMLVAQALKSQEIWLNKNIDNELIGQIMHQLISEKQNVVLIGMPSSGKSTIGKMLAERLNKKFIDVDEEIFKFTGSLPSQIILNKGEEQFRQIESEVIKELSKQNSLVIATGGGAVLKEINRKNLIQNGKIVYIKRDLNKLVSDGRPLSQGRGIEQLFNERKDIYQNFADIEVENNLTIEDCVRELIEKL